MTPLRRSEYDATILPAASDCQCGFCAAVAIIKHASYGRTSRPNFRCRPFAIYPRTRAARSPRWWASSNSCTRVLFSAKKKKRERDREKRRRRKLYINISSRLIRWWYIRLTCRLVVVFFDKSCSKLNLLPFSFLLFSSHQNTIGFPNTHTHTQLYIRRVVSSTKAVYGRNGSLCRTCQISRPLHPI